MGDFFAICIAIFSIICIAIFSIICIAIFSIIFIAIRSLRGSALAEPKLCKDFVN
jgi:hypothetical protein